MGSYQLHSYLKHWYYCLRNIGGLFQEVPNHSWQITEILVHTLIHAIKNPCASIYRIPAHIINYLFTNYHYLIAIEIGHQCRYLELFLDVPLRVWESGVLLYSEPNQIGKTFSLRSSLFTLQWQCFDQRMKHTPAHMPIMVSMKKFSRWIRKQKCLLQLPSLSWEISHFDKNENGVASSLICSKLNLHMFFVCFLIWNQRKKREFSMGLTASNLKFWAHPCSYCVYHMMWFKGLKVKFPKWWYHMHFTTLDLTCVGWAFEFGYAWLICMQWELRYYCLFCIRMDTCEAAGLELGTGIWNWQYTVYQCTFKLIGMTRGWKQGTLLVENKYNIC